MLVEARRRLFAIAVVAVASSVFFGWNDARADYVSKVRDVVHVEGVKRNVFVGYGLVVGLPGTGDSRSVLASRSLRRFLSFSGLEVDEEELVRTRNIAAVAVSAQITGFQSKGDLVLVHVSSLADATSLDDGMLLTTALKGTDGQTSLVASGVVHTGDDGNNRRGTIVGGGTVERNFGSMQQLLGGRRQLNLRLKTASFGTMEALTKAAEGLPQELQVTALDDRRLVLSSQTDKAISFESLGKFMDLQIPVSLRARVVIDKKAGIIVLGEEVKLESAVIVLDDLNIGINQRSDAADNDRKGNVLPSPTTVQDLADGLTALGVNITKTIAILEALSQSGALNAEVVVQ